MLRYLSKDHDITASGNTGEIDLTLGNEPQLNAGCAWLFDITAFSGTSPTIDVTLEHSPDGVTWYTVEAKAQQTGTATLTRFTRENLFGRVRISWVIGGTVSSGLADIAIES